MSERKTKNIRRTVRNRKEQPVRIQNPTKIGYFDKPELAEPQFGYVEHHQLKKNAPVEAIAGVGIKTAEELHKQGIYTVGDYEKSQEIAVHNPTYTAVSAYQHHLDKVRRDKFRHPIESMTGKRGPATYSPLPGSKVAEAYEHGAHYAPETYQQFVKERMGPYMKQYGSHGAAIKQIAKEWQEYKAQTPNKEPKKTTDITLDYNKYKGSGKAWAARVQLRKGIVSDRTFLNPVASERDNYKGTKVYEIPLEEGAIYEFNESGTKSSDSRFLRIVKEGKLEKYER